MRGSREQLLYIVQTYQTPDSLGLFSTSKFVRIWRLALMETHTLPGPFAFDLNLERPTQKGTDEHDEAKHSNALEGRVDSDTVDDVGSDQEFQPEHDRSPQEQ